MLSFLVAVLALLGFALRARADPPAVFAHVIVGNTYSYTQANWASDIKAAQAAGIDGFALNIAYTDTTNSNGNVQTQLNNAYNAADAVGFKNFISFDYAAQGAWDSTTVIKTINDYKSHSSQFLYSGKPLASTFEGYANAGDWSNIKSQTGCFFMPDYSSQGATGAANEPNVDGLLSWDAWPNGATDMTDSDDKAYVAALGGRPYMMPVSPWFYTNIPNVKNWLWRGDDLWHERWQQVLDVNPALVEILTWNDYGESHYVGPLPPSDSAIPSGAGWYVENIPHNAWLNDLPYYIAAYKKQATPNEPHVTLWYRLNPGTACSADGTTCNTATQGQTEIAPQDCDVDAIFFTAFVASSATATVHVTIGSSTQTVTASAPGIFHSSVPFNGNTGTVSISVSTSDGSTSLGPVQCPAITTSCTNGNVNWNTWVGGS